MLDDFRARLGRAFPILRWAPEYDPETARRDLWAGVTVGFVLVADAAAAVDRLHRPSLIVGLASSVGLLTLRRWKPRLPAELGHLSATRSFKRVEQFSEAEPTEGVLVLRVEAGFSFFNAKFMRDFILEKAQEEGTERAEEYERKAEQAEDEVEPTSETPLT